MVVQPKIRNNVCITAHPEGCAEEVRNQIHYVRSRGKITHGPKNVLVIGSSMGYGLASRISAAFGSGANTIGVSFEKAGSEDKPGTAGWYNTLAFDEEARKAGLISISINGDAFSREIKEETINSIKKHLGKVDLVVYSLASPVRVDPATGEMYRSVLKPIGNEYRAKSVDPFRGEVRENIIEPATQEEIAATVKVMGGEDWKLWIDALLAASVLDSGVLTLAYSYIGPDKTTPVYREGTIGKAKEDLERTARILDEELIKAVGGHACVSVNKALVTRASAVIPVVSLYITLLYRVMKDLGLHEGCIEQMDRMFREKLYSGKQIPLDTENRLRLDDWELRPEVQERINRLWDRVESDNISAIGDPDGFKEDFLRLHGFAVPGIDYTKESVL